MQLNEQEIDKMIDLVDGLCGLHLDHTKGYLIESRLESVAQRHGCQDYSELIDLAQGYLRAPIKNEIIDAITTNETLFFRDASPFNALKQSILPEVMDEARHSRRSRQLRIWSAACSTGQEAYSLAMTLKDVIPDISTWNISIKGTDVSPAAIEKAQAGVYSDLELSRGVPPELKSRYFSRKGHSWEIIPEIRKMVRFENRNLLAPFLEKNVFDIVLCRNVAIYFKKQDRANLFNRIVDTLAPGGTLFVGSSENLSDLGPKFVPESLHNCTIYRPKPKSAALAAR